MLEPVDSHLEHFLRLVGNAEKIPSVFNARP